MREINVALVLLLCAFNVAAVPCSSSSSSCRGQQQQQQQQLAPWRRFTNGIIAKLWGVQDCHSPNTATSADIPEATRARSGRLAARYGQDIVLRFNVSTAAEARAIAEASEDLYLDVWEFSAEHVDIRLAKDVVPSLLGLLPASLQHAHAPLMPHFGLAEIIDKSLPSPLENTRPTSSRLADLSATEDRRAFTPSLQPGSGELFFDDYQPLSVISPWMRLMASMFPTHVRLITIGVSWEGRDIEALRIGVKPAAGEDPPRARKTIIVSGGLHAREWISTSTVTYTAYKMITLYGRSNGWTRLMENFDWVFIPTMNPDGYVYTWETDRLWRKNRQPTSLRFCRGIDLDRSFGFQWDGDVSGGNPCSESFAGEEPWQAVESKRFADWARNETENNNVEFLSLLDLHSYSQQVLYPYSYSCAASPPTLENLEELAMGLAKHLRMGHHPHYYKTTSACEGNVNLNNVKGRPSKQILPRIERGGGSALDWFYHELRVKYAYQIKLRDMGSYGFMLPKENIVPQGKEMMNAISYLGQYLAGQIGVAVRFKFDGEGGELHDGEELEPIPLSEEKDPQESRHGGKDDDDNDDGADAADMPIQEIFTEDAREWELKRRRRR